MVAAVVFHSSGELRDRDRGGHRCRSELSVRAPCSVSSCSSCLAASAISSSASATIATWDRRISSRSRQPSALKGPSFSFAVGSSLFFLPSRLQPAAGTRLRESLSRAPGLSSCHARPASTPAIRNWCRLSTRHWPIRRAAAASGWSASWDARSAAWEPSPSTSLTRLRLQQGLAELEADRSRTCSTDSRTGSRIDRSPGCRFSWRSRDRHSLTKTMRLTARFDEFANDEPCPVLDPADRRVRFVCGPSHDLPRLWASGAIGRWIGSLRTVLPRCQR